MIQGTGSDVGKSVIVAGLCRIARRRGLSVAPFKPQNMSNNAAATAEGGEIGRAQALQAQAAGLELSTDFNPVLLKPQSDRAAQVIVHGRARHTLAAADYMERRAELIDAVMESYHRLASRHDLVLVEGAGSPAEINLRERDIANMGFAREAGIPVCLVGDIDRGGVIAALVGTQAVIEPADALMIRGFLINRFRGDPRLFDSGVAGIEQRTGWPCLGVIPWLHATARLPAEDAVSMRQTTDDTTNTATSKRLRIVAPMLSRMANFDDADPLRLEPGLQFDFIAPGKALPRAADVIILFGTKSSLGDLAFLREQGWDHDIIAHARAGGRVLGICGGFQMLGKRIVDTDGIDGPAGEAPGLGLLDIETTMCPGKRIGPVRGECASSGIELEGYEIHVGRVTGRDLQRPLLRLDDDPGHRPERRPEGACSADGLVQGSHVHGLFTSDEFRRHWLQQIGVVVSDIYTNYREDVDQAIEELADELEAHVDVDALFALACAPGGWKGP